MRRRGLAQILLLGLALGTWPLACGSNSVPSPFGPQAGGSGGGGGETAQAGFGLEIDAGVDAADPTLGGPCSDDEQCDDEVDCTSDRCDAELGRCRFQPDDARCGDDATYCNGSPRCDLREGCQAGEPIACSDGNTCTIDVCVETTQSCRHDPRDGDGDGDPSWNCGGADCDDTNPLISSLATEVCDNARDDDCDQQLDEQECGVPEHDTCIEALEVTQSGYYDLELSATGFDYQTPCTRDEDAVYRDVVVAIIVPEGAPQDVDLIATMDQGSVSLATAPVCGEAADVSCEAAFDAPLGGSVSRLVLRDRAPGAYPIYLSGTKEAAAQLKVTFAAAQGPLPGPSCEQALELTEQAPVELRMVGYESDVSSLCDGETGQAFVGFSLAEPRDVTLVVEAQDSLGVPVLSLRDESCAEELTCRRSQPGRLFARALPAGNYVVAISGSGPADVSVRLETAPATQAPPGEGCSEPPTLGLGIEELVDLSERADAVYPECLAGAPDATFGFVLAGARDVGLLGRFSDGDTGAVSIASAECQPLPLQAQCSVSSGRRAFEVSYALPAGEYRAIAESARGNPVALSRFERAALPPFEVSLLGDDCDSVVTVPETGARFVGNTFNAFPDFAAGCDVGGGNLGGAPDQLLKLVLSEPRRVVLDLTPTDPADDFSTLLSVRQGDSCPGVELPMACAAGRGSYRSFLDLQLEPGSYFIQIDGYDGARGAWNLDVFTALE